MPLAFDGFASRDIGRQAVKLVVYVGQLLALELRLAFRQEGKVEALDKDRVLSVSAQVSTLLLDLTFVSEVLEKRRDYDVRVMLHTLSASTPASSLRRSKSSKSFSTWGLE